MPRKDELAVRLDSILSLFFIGRRKGMLWDTSAKSKRRRETANSILNSLYNDSLLKKTFMINKSFDATAISFFVFLKCDG